MTQRILDRAALRPEIDDAIGRPESRRRFIAKLLTIGVSASGLEMFSSYASAVERNQQQPLRDSYDYVIAGAGSAGCLLADRLSATGASVLLIEAGSDQIDQPKITDVANWMMNFFSDTDWARIMEAQPQLANRSIGAAAGKILGGSGSTNAMIWLRGDPRDYAQWNRMVGSDWTPAALNRSYLKVIQTASPVGASSDAGVGRITVGRYADQHPLTAAYMSAAAATGLNAIDLNSGIPLDGAGIAEVNATAAGRRVGPAQALLLPALVRQNLQVITNTQVASLLIEGGICKGVAAVIDGVVTKIWASKEVIVSAGTCASPQVLMLSGIGPAGQLAALGIPVRQDLPAVGKNFQDHVLLSVGFKSKVSIPPQVSNGVSIMAYYNKSPRYHAPDIQVAGMQYPFGLANAAPGSAYTVIPFLAKPRSKGGVRLVNTDYRQPLSLDPRYLDLGVDQETMLMGLDRALEIGSTREMKQYYGGLYDPAPLKTRAERLAFIAQRASAALHFVGTCSAGHDPTSSVVDGRFRVWGVPGLRIVDASVIPEMPAVNIQPSVLTLAQLAADHILQDAGGACAAQ